MFSLWNSISRYQVSLNCNYLLYKVLLFLNTYHKYSYKSKTIIGNINIYFLITLLRFEKNVLLIRWEVYGEQIYTDENVIISNNSQTLIIKDTLVSNANRYTCFVSNTVGRASRDIDLIVYGKFQLLRD